jgi:transcriptional regulator with XRE-family HTH domain
METKQILGGLLKARRKILKLTAEELADKAGIDRTYITKIETDDKLPSPAIMEKIANALSDEDLFKAYIKIKYPMVYSRVKAGDLFLDVEIGIITEEIGKKSMTLEETKKLEWRIKRFDILSKKAKIKLKKLTKKLQEIEDL